MKNSLTRYLNPWLMALLVAATSMTPPPLLAQATGSARLTAPTAVPTITSFTPTSGPVGTTVTITGTNFTGATHVYFNGWDAGSYTVVNSTTITATSPGGQGTGPIEVVTPGGSATSTANFVAAQATISSFTPTSGPVGTTVTITGTNFTGATNVYFNGTNAGSFTVVNSTTITATSPGGQGTGQIEVVTPNGSATSTASFVAAQATISSFTPTSGPAGTTVTITGTNFTGATGVYFNGTGANGFTVVNATTITAVSPGGQGTGQIEVYTPNGSATSTASFVPTQTTISSFNPTSGPAGTTITITGTNFTGATAVYFNNTAASSYTVVNSTTITAVSPGGQGTGHVSVYTPNGSAESTASFVAAQATITSFSPTSGAAGTTVTITGTNLTGAVSVYFNNTAVTGYTVVNSTTITTTVPYGCGTGTIYVGTPNGNATSTANFVGPLTKITSFTPTSGGAGTVVTITGVDLLGATSVYFNNTAATSFNVVSNTTITAVAPGGSGTGPMYVSAPNGSAYSTANFTATLTPTIVSFTPTSGPTGTSVVITGSNFTGATAVKFNGTASASYTVNSANQITATVPAGATTGKVSVTGPNGTGTSTANFTVTTTALPTITSFTPTSGPIGTTVTITGTNFTGATAVKFHGTSATSFTVVSATSITATVPTGATTGTLSVTTPSGTATSTASFTVTVPAPTLTSFTPTTGCPGITVTITGTNFTGTTAVKFNGTSAASFTVVSATSITAVVPAGATAGTISVTTPAGTATSSSSFTPTAPPTITSFSPTTAAVGATVTITGTNFTGATAVKFNGTSATSFTVVSATSITATVPAGATSGTISVTSVCGTVVTSTATFTVTSGAAPTLVSFTPTTGPVGTLVTIMGTNFTGATQVKFNATAAVTYSVVSATQITAIVPAGATTGKITVVAPGGTVISSANFTVVTVPVITSFSPASGPAGTAVTITGTGFSATAASNTVFFGGTKATVTAATATSLTVTAPAGTGYQPIQVTVSARTGQSWLPFLLTYAGGATPGTASFGRRADMVAGSGPVALALADLNFDGKPDVVAANALGNNVSLFRNAAVSGSLTSASLAAKVDVATGTQPQALAVADLDGDGKLDVITANAAANTVSVLRNGVTTAGAAFTTTSLAAKVDYAVGTAPQSVAAGDLNADGRTDLVTANYIANSVSVLQNATTAAGAFTAASFATVGPFTTGIKPQSVALVDVDGDGKLDIVTANYGANTISVLRNTSTVDAISFAPKVDFATGTNPYMVASGDIDGDGKPDLLTANLTTSAVSVLRNTATAGTLTSTSLAARVNFTTTTAAALTLADFDGAGKVDVAIGQVASDQVGLLRNVATAGSILTSSLAAVVNYAVGAAPYGIAAGDLDGDGRADLVSANYIDNTLSLLRNRTADPTVTTFSPGSGPVGTTVTITGTLFTGATAVKFGGVAATTFTVVSATSITAVVPTGAVSGQISVVTPAGTGTSTGAFVVVAARPGPAVAGQPVEPVQLAVFPNPASARVTLLLTNAADGTPITAELVDGLGRVVRRAALPTGQTELTLDGIPAGVYTVRLRGVEAPLRRLVVE